MLQEKPRQQAMRLQVLPLSLGARQELFAAVSMAKLSYQSLDAALAWTPAWGTQSRCHRSSMRGLVWWSEGADSGDPLYASRDTELIRTHGTDLVTTCTSQDEKDLWQLGGYVLPCEMEPQRVAHTRDLGWSYVTWGSQLQTRSSRLMGMTTSL